jgi:hypothetical protein
MGPVSKFVKGHAMHKPSRKDPLELTELILKNHPYASTEQIAGIISDWGNLFDDQRFSFDESVFIESVASKGGPFSRIERSNGSISTSRH